MRFIGNKTNLLERIKEVIDENCNDGSQIFCDIFSGTGSVSRFFKPYYRIISNDLLYFSHILTAATIENNSVLQLFLEQHQVYLYERLHTIDH